jgi:hypothetical protein
MGSLGFDEFKIRLRHSYEYCLVGRCTFRIEFWGKVGDLYIILVIYMYIMRVNIVY